MRNSGTLALRGLALVVGHAEAVVPATDANKYRPLLDSLAGGMGLPRLRAVAEGRTQPGWEGYSARARCSMRVCVCVCVYVYVCVCMCMCV